AADVGLDGDHPRLRAAGGRVRRAVAAHLDRRGRPRPLRRRRDAAAAAVPGHARRRDARARRALGRPAVALRRQPRREAPEPGRHALPAGRRRRRALLARRHARRPGRRRGLRHGDRDDDGRHRPAHRPQRHPGRRAAGRPAARARRRPGRVAVPRLHRRRPRPLRGVARRGARRDRLARRRPWARPRGGVRAAERRRRPADQRDRRRAELGRRHLRPARDLRRGRHVAGAEERPAGLRRELRFWEAIALSIGIMAPTAAMALNGVAPAGLIGRAVPLAFLLAAIGVLFVSYGFIRLSRYFSHAGSAFAFSGITLGPQAGFFAGWALLGTYVAFCCASTAEAGTFGVAFLSGINIDKSADYLVIALIAAALIALLAFGDIRIATRSLLGMEGISVTLIVILMVVIMVKLIAGSSPGGQTVTVDAFKLPPGTSLSAVASAAVFGFLSFGGFEGAAALGEETDNPRREIPRAIRNAVIGCGVFYILCILVQTWGFGANAAGAKAFSGSAAPLGDLAHSYVGSSMEDAINFGATISAFA